MPCNNDKTDSFTDSTFTFDELELESFMYSLDEQYASFDACGAVGKESSSDFDPIPFDGITPEGLFQALVPFSAPLNFCFAPTSAPATQEPPQEEKEAPRRQKPRARKASKTVSKRSRASTKTKKASTKTKGLIDMKDFCPQTDVLFGRGGHAVHNPGNSFLLSAVVENRHEYKSLDKTKEGKEKKNMVIQRVVAKIQARGGRFLIRESSNAPWQEASYEKVHKKIGHMLRD